MPLRVGVKDAMQILGISRTRLYQHMKAGRIRWVKDGARTLFSVAELNRFVEENDGAPP